MPRTFLFSVYFLFVLLLSSAAAEVEIILDLSALDEELHPLIHELSELPPSLQGPGPVKPIWLERYREQLPGKIGEVLEPQGYFHPVVSFAEETIEQRVLLRIWLDPGPAVRLVETDIRLREKLPDQPQLGREHFPLKPGDRLREDLYEKGKAELLARVRDQGFLEARFTRQELRVDRQQNQGRILLEITAGRRSRFGAVAFVGGEEYPPRFLRRYLAIEPGEPFSYRLLAKTQKQLRNSDRFRRVLVVPVPARRDGDRVPIDIELASRKRYTLRPGAGFGTDTGARVSLRFHDRNAWELGHDFNLDLLLAERLQNFTGSYSFPSYRNLNTGISLHGGYRAEQLKSYDNRYVFAEVEQTYGFGGERIGALFVRAQYEHSDISAESIFTGFLMPGLRYTEVQLPEETGKGYGFRLQAEGRFTDRHFFSDVSLAQLLGDGDLVLPLPWRLSLNLRGQGAMTIIDNPFTEIPASLRFFAGGDRSVRGYAYQSLGPKNDQGEVVGGKHLLSGSVELGKRIGENWGLALFVDGGNAFDSWSDYALAFGAGGGLRYATPVGPIRVDLASPVGDGALALRLHIGIGFGW